MLTAALVGAAPASASSRAAVATSSASHVAVSQATGSQATGSQATGTAPPVPPAAQRGATAPVNSGVYPGGGVFHFGDAASVSGTGGSTFSAPVVGMAADPGGTGVWLAAANGAVHTEGGAPNYGSMTGTPLTAPVVGIAATPDGRGYWLVALDGGIFTFGDARFYGSTGAMRLNQPVVGMAATPTGGGYWLVAADGGIFTFGNATFDGSLGGATLQSGIASMAVTSAGTGYWLLEWNGTVFTFGTAQSYGEPTGSPAASPFKQLVPTSTGKGYWLLEPDGFNYSFSSPGPTGGYPAIVAAAASQIAPDPNNGYFCNPYGTCEPWCALFATWAWQKGGVPIPSYAFVGNIYTWAAANGSVLASNAMAVPGDAILYGTGPQNVTTAVHTGIVAQVWPDGAVDTIEGDAGPGVTGHLAVVVNGPFLPADAVAFANYPVFAIAQP